MCFAFDDVVLSSLSTLVILQAERVLDPSEVEVLKANEKSFLNEQLSTAGSYAALNTTLQEQWSSCVWPTSGESIHNPETGVEQGTLVQVGKASVKVPEGFVSL